MKRNKLLEKFERKILSQTTPNKLTLEIFQIIIHSKHFVVSDWLQSPGIIIHNQLALTIFE